MTATFHYLGRYYNATGRIDEWDIDAQKAYRDFAGNSFPDTPMCDFDIVCRRDGERKYCGGVPPYNIIAKPAAMSYPYFILYESSP